jgi:hypothetical protein
MTQPFDFLSRSIDLFRMLSSEVMSYSEELAVTQLDSAQECLTRYSRQLRNTLADLGALQGPEQSPAVVEASLRHTLEMTRDIVVTGDEFQMKTLLLMQQKTAKTQQILHDALDATLGTIPAPSGHKLRARKSDAEASHQLAA